METRQFGAYPTHPGEVLKDEIEYRRITQRQLATELGIPYSRLNDILNAKRPMTAQIAYMIEAVMGISAEMLLKLQLNYDMQTTQSSVSFMEKLSKLRRIAAVL